MAQKAGRPPINSFWCNRLRAWITQDSCYWSKGGVSGAPIPESSEFRSLPHNVQEHLKACRLEFFLKGRTLIDVSTRRPTLPTPQTHIHLAHGQATCADAIASALGIVKGGDGWMEALGLKLTGHREFIAQGKSSTKKRDHGHTQQTLNSSGTLEPPPSLPPNMCLIVTRVLRKTIAHRPISGQVRSEIDAILVD